MFEIRKHRLEKGYSQAALAEKAKIAQPYLNQLELGVRTNPSYEVLARLAEALEIDIKELLKVG